MREEIEPKILQDCHNANDDFLRILMETIARKQGVERWAESTPLHLLYLPTHQETFPMPWLCISSGMAAM